jgi:hypothetical protein
VLRDDRLAAAATLLFVFNPASVFHAAPYSEAAFFCCTAVGLWALYCRGSGVLAAAAFAASTWLRSNGMSRGSPGVDARMRSRTTSKPLFTIRREASLTCYCARRCCAPPSQTPLVRGFRLRQAWRRV